LHIENVVKNIIGLIAVTDAMHQLIGGCGVCQSAEQNIRAMTDELESIMLAFHQSGEAGKSVLQQTEVVCMELSQELEVMASEIRTYRNVTKTMEQVEDILERVARESRSQAPEFILSEVDRNLEEMKKRYTMDAERDTHSAYVEGRDMHTSKTSVEEGLSNSSIELF
jgi:DNA polymerase III delta prime subunit